MTAPDQTNAEVSDERLREIEPCPFCDGEAALYSNPDGNVVECKFCFCCSPERDDASEAITAWNRRSGTSQASEGEVVPVAWVTLEILEAMKRGERVVLGWKQSADFNIPLVAASPSKRVERLETAHPDDISVDRFAAAMKAKLAKKRAEGRSGWQDKFDCAREFLSQLLRGHVEKGDPLDVGNLAMMLHERGETIADARAIASWAEREADRNMGLPR